MLVRVPTRPLHGGPATSNAALPPVVDSTTNTSDSSSGSDNDVADDESSFEARLDDTQDGTSHSTSRTNKTDTEQLKQQRRRTFIKWNIPKKRRSKPKREEFDLNDYMSKRRMTKFQEQLNALTMLPFPVVCLWYIYTGQWRQFVVETEEGESCLYNTHDNTNSTWLPPTPLPVLAVALGFLLHSPFSFLYHWKYAHTLPPGKDRTLHWSRRLDQAMIHVCSTCLCYATTPNHIPYVLWNALYNIDCIRKHFSPTVAVRPGRNQARIGLSLLAYTLPLVSKNAVLFGQIWAIFFVAGFFFICYPIGGYSHALFHMILVAVVPLLFQAATQSVQE